MWRTPFIIIAAASIVLAGCNKQQQVEANNSAQRAKKETQQAVHNAKQALSDGSITLKVKTAMSASDKLNTSGINVDTKNRVVYLKGAVADANQKALAERIAKDTVGPDVKVVDQLQVRPPNAPNTKVEKK